MEQLKKLGDVCRKHYEKLVLIFVLLLLGGAVWFLYQESVAASAQIEKWEGEFLRKKGTGVVPPDLSRFNSALKEMTNPPAINFSGNHNLVNPVRWIVDRNTGELKPIRSAKDYGPGNLQLVRTRPLLLSIAYGRASTSTANQVTNVLGYQLYITNELTLRGGRAAMTNVFTAVNETNKPGLVLTGVSGPAEAPTELTATLKGFDGERITFTPERPYHREIGREAELKYPAGNKNFPGLRIGTQIDIEGEPYKVVDITPNRVVLFDNSNGERINVEQALSP